VITVVASDPNASEVGLDPGTFTLTRSGSNAFDLVVTFDREGTASGGFDYLTFNTAVIFPAGQSSVTITVEPFADAFVEGPETVTVILADGAHYDVGTPSSATVTIADAAAPVITVIASDPNASEVGLDPGAFTLTRSGSNAFDLVVSFDRVGTASFGADYLTFNTAVNFPAGQSSVLITVSPFADSFVEVPETVTVILTDGAHYDVGTPSSATVTIADSP
jgi:hypothetical protein